MIHALAERMASAFVSGGAADPEDKDIYTYGCETILSACFTFVSCMLVSLLFGRLLEGLLVFAVFVTIRHFTGGHHAEQHWGCILASSCICAGVLFIVSVLPPGLYQPMVAASALVALISIFILAPVEHKNKPLSARNRLLLKKKSRIVVLGFFAVVIAGVFLWTSPLVLAVSLSMLSVSGSMAYATLIHHMRKGGGIQ